MLFWSETTYAWHSPHRGVGRWGQSKQHKPQGEHAVSIFILSYIPFRAIMILHNTICCLHYRGQNIWPTTWIEYLPVKWQLIGFMKEGFPSCCNGEALIEVGNEMGWGGSKGGSEGKPQLFSPVELWTCLRPGWAQLESTGLMSRTGWQDSIRRKQRRRLWA